MLAVILSLTGGSCSDISAPEAEEPRLLFLSNRDDERSEFGRPLLDIYRMNGDGSGARALTPSSGGDALPSNAVAGLRRNPWSPDGKRIAFHRSTSGQEGIYVINVDGTGLRRAVAGYAVGFNAWSPQGNRFAYSADGDAFVAAADGNIVVNVSNSRFVDIEARWAKR